MNIQSPGSGLVFPQNRTCRNGIRTKDSKDVYIRKCCCRYNSAGDNELVIQTIKLNGRVKIHPVVQNSGSECNRGLRCTKSINTLVRPGLDRTTRYAGIGLQPQTKVRIKTTWPLGSRY